MIRRWFGRGRRGGDGGPRGWVDGAPSGAEPPALDVLLAQTVARHFAAARVDGAVVQAGFGELEIDCTVNEVSNDGGQWTAALFLRLSGGRFGGRPLFASINGYHRDSREHAIVEGACAWSCAFGPVLVSALTGVVDPEVYRDEVVVDGRRWQLVHGSFDRHMVARGTDGTALAADLRRRLGGAPQLAPSVVGAVPADLLARRSANLLGVFVMEGPGRRIVEVKVNGVDTPVDWPGDVPYGEGDGFALVRELAVLVPVDEPARSMPLPDPLDRAAVQAVLAHLGDRDTPGAFAGWRGWHTHGGRLGDVLPAEELARTEAATGPLPEDYRRFLTEVAGPGAGPGYGLLPPRRVGDVVPLAQAGCNAVWVLRVGDTDRGSVWVDSTPVDGRRHRVAASFTAWYRDWLDHGLRDGEAWTHWDPTVCVGAALVRHLASEDDGTGPRTAAGQPDLSGKVVRSVVVGGNDYLPGPGGAAHLDPCQGCAAELARYGVPEDVVERGVLAGPG